MTQSELEPLKSFRHGEVVLLQFPFTNLAGSRRRPSLVMLDTGGEDIVVARVTSQTERAVFDIRLNDWTAASLLLPSVVRLHKLATIQKSLVNRTPGPLSHADWARIRGAAESLWANLTSPT